MTDRVSEINSVEYIKAGKIAGIVGITVNIVLFIAKLVLGLIVSSVSIIGDAVNNLSDAASSVFVIVGYSLSGKPADKDHPYGHARIEYLTGLFISVIVAILGLELLKSSISSLFESNEKTKLSVITIIIISCTVLVKLFLAVYYKAVSVKINSASLKASAADSIGDVASTLAVIIGILLTPVFGPVTDGIVGIIISVYIIVIGVKLIKEASDTLIGTAPDPVFVDEIASEIRKYDGVLGIHDLVLHNYGKGCLFATVHVEIDADSNIIHAHDLVDNIEFDFLEKYGIRLVIHMDPICVSDDAVNELRDKVSNIISEISCKTGSKMSMHDFRVVFGVTHTNLVFDVNIDTDEKEDDKKLSDMIGNEIKKIDSSYNSVITIERGYDSHRYIK